MESANLIALIPSEPPQDLVQVMQKQENWWSTGVMTFRCVTKAEAAAALDCESLAADCRQNPKARPALLRCSECDSEILAEYIPRPHCKQAYGFAWSGVTLTCGPGNRKKICGDFHENSHLYCPVCGKETILYHTRSVRYGIIENHGAVVPVMRKNKLILEEWEISRDIWPNGVVKWSSRPMSAYIMDGKKWRKFVKARRAPFNNGIYPLEKWEELKTMRDTLGAPYLYRKDLPDLEGTVLENAKLWEYADQAYKKDLFFILGYIRLYIKHPQVENLITSGLGCFLGRAIKEECESYGTLYNGPYTKSPKLPWVNWKETKPHKMLGLTKEQLRTVCQENWGPSELKFFNEQDRWSFDAVAAALKMESLSTLQRIYEKKMPLKKTLNYLKKQGKSWVYLNDYWGMARRARMDLNQEIVRWPPHLRQAHDRLAETIRYKTSEKQRKTFAEMTERCRGLAWEHNGICIRPAETPEELVKEGQVLHHCVGGYSSSHAAGRIILFIRHARRPERSWFTLNVDVHTKRIIQNHGYGNERSPSGKHLTIPKEVRDFVALWEKEVLTPWQLPASPEKVNDKSAA